MSQETQRPHRGDKQQTRQHQTHHQSSPSPSCSPAFTTSTPSPTPVATHPCADQTKYCTTVAAGSKVYQVKKLPEIELSEETMFHCDSTDSQFAETEYEELSLLEACMECDEEALVEITRAGVFPEQVNERDRSGRVGESQCTNACDCVCECASVNVYRLMFVTISANVHSKQEPRMHKCIDRAVME